MMKSGFGEKKILVTAGSTKAYIDAVRYISNYSSGRLGSEIASECLRRGAEVWFLHGEGTLTPNLLAERKETQLSPEHLARLHLVPIESVSHLAQTLKSQLIKTRNDGVVHAMAVLDYIPDPAKVSSKKEKSDKKRWVIELIPTPKIIDLIKETSPSTRLVGFKLEVGLSRQDLLDSAIQLMQRSGADLVVANDMTDVQSDHYKAILVEQDQNGKDYITTNVEGRKETARLLCDHLEQWF